MFRRAASLLLAAGLIAVAAAPVTAAEPIGSQLAQVRAATARFHNVDAAIAAGYMPTDECVEIPLGGMGYHYVNVAAVLDPALDPATPEVLLYAPSGNGVRLVGVEWLVFDADQNPATVQNLTILGQSLAGPMTHSGLPFHYEKHAWTWQPNPNGVFADWNPAVDC